jgi:hypothetical protein
MHFHIARAAMHASIPFSRLTGLHAEWLTVRSFGKADKWAVKLKDANAYFELP